MSQAVVSVNVGILPPVLAPAPPVANAPPTEIAPPVLVVAGVLSLPLHANGPTKLAKISNELRLKDSMKISRRGEYCVEIIIPACAQCEVVLYSVAESTMSYCRIDAPSLQPATPHQSHAWLFCHVGTWLCGPSHPRPAQCKKKIQTMAKRSEWPHTQCLPCTCSLLVPFAEEPPELTPPPTPGPPPKDTSPPLEESVELPLEPLQAASAYAMATAAIERVRFCMAYSE